MISSKINPTSNLYLAAIMPKSPFNTDSAVIKMKSACLILIATLSMAMPASANEDYLAGVYLSESGEKMTASFNNQEHTVSLLLPNQKTVTLHLAISGSGARYTKGDSEFWEHHGQATYSENGKIIFVGKVLAPSTHP